jgi:hypothetical protein
MLEEVQMTLNESVYILFLLFYFILYSVDRVDSSQLSTIPITPQPPILNNGEFYDQQRLYPTISPSQDSRMQIPPHFPVFSNSRPAVPVKQKLDSSLCEIVLNKDAKGCIHKGCMIFFLFVKIYIYLTR